MAQTGNGTAKYVKTNGALAALSRYSVHLHYRNANASGTSATRRVVALADAAATYDAASFCWQHTATPRTWFHKRSTAVYDQATYPLAFDVDRWYRLGARFDGSALAAFLDGALSVSVTAQNPPVTPVPSFSALAGWAGTSEFDNGTVAEVALWDVALTDDEFAALGRALVCPLLVRPASLRLYWPLIRDPVGVLGPAIAHNTPTVADHSPVVYARQRQALRLTSSKVFLVTGSGGVRASGTADIAAQYAVTGSGGVRASPASDVISVASFSSALGFAQSAPATPPEFTNALALADAWSLGDSFARLSQAVRFKGTFSADSGALHTKRSRGRNA